MPIHWAIKHLFPFQILQFEGVVLMYLSYHKRANPQRFKLSMFSLVLPDSIPLDDPISNLKVVHFFHSAHSASWKKITRRNRMNQMTWWGGCLIRCSCSKSGNRWWKGQKLINRRSRSCLKKGKKWTTVRLDIWSSSGILSGRTRENMESLTLCGLSLLW